MKLDRKVSDNWNNYSTLEFIDVNFVTFNLLILKNQRHKREAIGQKVLYAKEQRSFSTSMKVPEYCQIVQASWVNKGV